MIACSLAASKWASLCHECDPRFRRWQQAVLPFVMEKLVAV
jgi:hypothetical protein